MQNRSESVFCFIFCTCQPFFFPKKLSTLSNHLMRFTKQKGRHLNCKLLFILVRSHTTTQAYTLVHWRCQLREYFFLSLRDYQVCIFFLFESPRSCENKTKCEEKTREREREREIKMYCACNDREYVKVQAHIAKN